MAARAGPRVLLVSPFDPFGDGDDPRGAHLGGVERVVAGSARALARRGLDVRVLATGRAAGVREVDGVTVETARRRGTLFRTPLSPAALAPLEADAVHVPASYPLWSDLLVARSARRQATVLDFHFEPHGAGIPMRLAAGLWRRTLAPLLRRAHVVLTRSREYAAASRLLAGVPPSRLREVPVVVDLERFRPAGRKEGYVLVVGRLVPYKGVEVLLEAMRSVQSRRPEARLVVAGEGPLRPRLEALARARGVAASFLGYVPDAELASLYARAAVTALPSVNGQEAFGVSLLESQAAGTPVVASDLPGVRRVARPGGLVVPPRDPQALAEALSAVLEERVSLPSASDLRRRVAERHTEAALGDALLDAYRHAEVVRCASSP